MIRSPLPIISVQQLSAFSILAIASMLTITVADCLPNRHEFLACSSRGSAAFAASWFRRRVAIDVASAYAKIGQDGGETTPRSPGKPDGYFIVDRYDVPVGGFPEPRTARGGLFRGADIERLGLTSANVTLPSALMMLDPERYPDVRASLGAARNGSILVQRGGRGSLLDVDGCRKGKVGDRIYPSDTLWRQEWVDVGASDFWRRSYRQDGKFGLHVVFEDDYIAIVNKPGGVNLYEHSAHATGDAEEKTVKDMLPFVLKPPVDGVAEALPRPEAAHRLDKLTSGLLLVAKTRPSLRHLSVQFRSLGVEKTYTAVCYSVPEEGRGAVDSSDEGEGNGWHLIDEALDGKAAITFWRLLKQFEYKGTSLSLVELKPKTGRYRQLRRHMARVKGCPLVGDAVFARGIERGGDGAPASELAKLGLFLCSSGARFEHPYYGATECKEWTEDAADVKRRTEHCMEGATVRLYSEGERVLVHARIEPPAKFNSLMQT